MTNEQKAKYKIMSFNRCARYCEQKHNNTSIIISITTYDGDLYEKIKITDTNNVQDILYLSFCDFEYDDMPNGRYMSHKDGQKVAEFVNKWYDKVDTIIVHCEGGISRSAGVCAGIMRAKEGEDYPVFDNRNKHPNMTCYLQTLKGFNYELLKL